MLINRKAVKEFALGVSAVRAHRFTRVSNDFLESIDFKVRDIIRREIMALPSKGKTIK